MPRKTRKQLADRNEEQEQNARDKACQRLERELRTLWRESEVIRLSGAFPEVEAYPSAL